MISLDDDFFVEACSSSQSVCVHLPLSNTV